MDNPGPLAGLTVIEYGDGTAAPYAAKLLGDYGADVIKIEPPEGDSSRRRGPFPHNTPDPEASGLFHYLNTNKRGIILDPLSRAGEADLHRLLEHADIFITNRPNFADLRTRHPNLVITIISPFGTTGPWANNRGDELVTYAMGGLAYSTPGVPDAAAHLIGEPPLHPACYIAETISGVAAAVATLTAILAGTGCLIDLSQQAAVAAMQQRDITEYSYRGGTYNRLLNPTTTGRMPNFYLPCRDGHVVIPAPLDMHWARLVEAMGSPAWAISETFATGPARTENWQQLFSLLSDWTGTLTGAELYAIGTSTQLPIFQFHHLRETLASPHLAARGSLAEITLSDIPARMPGPPVAMRGTPWSLRRPAPHLGEHTEEILGQ
jgi:crotonobetainyl-CoA:carnitine CoA-transferase CaiB-like acyl-CoA transferase